VPPKRRFVQDPHGFTSQKTAPFIVIGGLHYIAFDAMGIEYAWLYWCEMAEEGSLHWWILRS
jgi:hypothetical protein